MPSSGAVRLAWNPSPEGDVAAYAVYRAGDTGELMRIATALTPGTVYTDRDILTAALVSSTSPFFFRQLLSLPMSRSAS